MPVRLVALGSKKRVTLRQLDYLVAVLAHENLYGVGPRSCDLGRFFGLALPDGAFRLARKGLLEEQRDYRGRLVFASTELGRAAYYETAEAESA
jgi:hypothetical protein